ncbi:hypothetical protein GCM10022226_79710 [Sphaerisporangium flaviroseum]|uniref:Uncharacterized protein n=2 Tax=Sphaerisporangium flaviroseum TaxID=509199 RepID=A0ABP7JI10_9ACTN
MVAAAALSGALAISQNQEQSAAVQPVVTASASTGLPERFTATDGVPYRLLGQTTLKVPLHKKGTLTVPSTGKPFDLAATCTGGRHAITPQIRVGGRPLGAGGLGPCVKGVQLLALPVPKGAKEVTATFDATTARSGCVRSKPSGSCTPVAEEEGAWTFGIYEWIPPGTAVEPGPVKAFPHVKGYRALRTTTGLWPRDPSTTLHVRGGQTVGADQLCSGALAARLSYTLLLNGKPTGVGGQCGVWEKGSYPMAMSLTEIPPGKDAELTIRWSMRGPDGNRPVRWSAGFWEQIK